MSTYKTKNPLGSAAVKDLYDNAENVDKFVNDRTKEELEDRLGVLRKTWHGMEMIFSRFIDYITGRGEQAVAAIGWQELGNWAVGLAVDNRQQIVYYNGSWYKYLGELEHVIAGDSPENDGGVWSAENPTGKWSNIGDAALRSNLGSGDGIKWIGGLGYTTPEKYLARGDGVTDDTAALQLAIFEAKMSGREVLLSSMYLISDGFKLDSTVTIRGTGKASGFVTSDSITSQRILFHITADNVTLENFSILTSADGFGAVGSVGCYAIRIVDNVERTRICGLNIDGRHYGAMGFCTGISISWSNHGFYQNNNIQNCSVGFHGGGSFNVIDGNICDNHFVDDPDNFTNEWDSTSMYWDGFMFEGLKYSAITNNTATNNGQSGIYFGGGGSSVSCYNIISGNIANWNFNHGIDNGVSGTQSATNDVYGNTINGNICKNNRYNGIWLGTVHDIVVNSNIVVIDEEHKAKFNSRGDSSGIGLRLNTTKNCVVSDNDVFVTANEFSSIYFRGVGNVLGDNRIRGKDIIVENLMTNNSAKGLTGTFKPTIAVGSGVTLDSTATRGTYSINNNKIVYDLDLNITTSSATGPLQLSGFPFLASGTIYQYLGQCPFTSGMKAGFYQGNIGVNVYANNSVVTIAALVTGVSTDIGTYLGNTVRMRIKLEIIMNAADFEGTFN
ncbi:right-handed parallel beta-helix repeat-containing protein [Klebsiella variicola]|uniref:glycosyl hydrolase family 28-related protein n=1 Tax=Klebsiella variicola TaxID=244366 RepID=UPI00186716D3|nr:glycosyl hydrolase family 28-related protein [Klebsiella variicola]